jgi:hypothetical protein
LGRQAAQVFALRIAVSERFARRKSANVVAPNLLAFRDLL